MTKTEAIIIYDNALKGSNKDDKIYASIAKYLATISDAKRADYLRTAPSVEKALNTYK